MTLSRRTVHLLLTASLAVALAMGAAACGDDDNGGGGGEDGGGAAQPGEGKPAVTLGAKNFTEQFILGQLYTQALEAKGYTVNLKNNIGSSEITYQALKSGKIDGYPEYTGTILSVLAGQDRRPSSAEAAFDAAKAFAERNGFTLTTATPFQNRDEFGVLKSFADQNGLKAIPDVKKLGARMTWGAPPESRTRFEGLVGLREVYGLTEMKFKPLAIGLQYKALDDGTIQGADVFNTDGQLASGKYVVLEDPENVFGFQNVGMLISQKTLDAQGPEFLETIDAVSAKLTTEAMRRMNAAVDIDKQQPAAVAKQFLEANNLLGSEGGS